MNNRYITLRVVLYAIMLVTTSVALVYQVCRSGGEIPPPPESLGQRDWSEIAKAGGLVIATDYGATQSRHDAKELERLYQLAHYITKRTGIRVEICFEPRLDNLFGDLEAGRIDLLAGHLPRTSLVDTARFGWVRAIRSEPLLLAQRSDTARITSLVELTGGSIALPSESVYKIFVEHLAQEVGLSLEMVEYPDVDTDSLLHLIREGRLDYTLCPSSRAKHYAAKYPELDITLPITHSLLFGWVARRSSPALLDSLELWLQTSSI